MSKYIVNMSAAFKHLCISVHLCWRNHREELPIVLVWKYKVKKLFQQEQSPSVQTWALSVKLTDKRSFGFHLDQWKLLEVLKVACDGWVAEFRIALCFHKCIILLFLRNVYCVRVRAKLTSAFRLVAHWTEPVGEFMFIGVDILHKKFSQQTGCTFQKSSAVCIQCVECKWAKRHSNTENNIHFILRCSF